MGYRSDVCFVMKFINQAEAIKFHGEVVEHVSSILNRNDYGWIEKCIYVGKRYFVFDCPELKWYRSYEDVDYLSGLYEGWAERKGCVGYLFCRVGDDTDDFETLMGGDCEDMREMISVEVMISKDLPPPNELEDKDDEDS